MTDAIAAGFGSYVIRPHRANAAERTMVAQNINDTGRDGSANAPIANPYTLQKPNLLGTPILGIANNGLGAIRVQVNSTADFTTGQMLSVFGAPANTNANRRWRLTVVDPTHVDLVRSVFANAAGAGGTLGYVLRPPWKVAGVDYPVGINASALPLKDPANLPTAFPRQITISGIDVNVNGSGLTIDGYDFSMNGGYRVILHGSNTTFRNCYWSPTTAPYGNSITMTGSPGCSIEYCAFNLNKYMVGQNGSLNYYVGIDGDFSIKYSYMIYGFAMFLGGGGGNFTAQYTFFQNEGYGHAVNGDHGDIIQLYGGTIGNALIQYNTYLHNQVGSGPYNQCTCQGFSQQGYISGTFDWSNNTMVGPISPAVAGRGNNLNNWFLPDLSRYSNTAPMNLSNNYCDPTVLNGGNLNGLFGVSAYWCAPNITAAYGTTTGKVLNGSGNKNMIDGLPLTKRGSTSIGTVNIVP